MFNCTIAHHHEVNSHQITELPLRTVAFLVNRVILVRADENFFVASESAKNYFANDEANTSLTATGWSSSSHYIKSATGVSLVFFRYRYVVSARSLAERFAARQDVVEITSDSAAQAVIVDRVLQHYKSGHPSDGLLLYHIQS